MVLSTAWKLGIFSTFKKKILSSGNWGLSAGVNPLDATEKQLLRSEFPSEAHFCQENRIRTILLHFHKFMYLPILHSD